jgi:hypothetical protein
MKRAATILVTIALVLIPLWSVAAQQSADQPTKMTAAVLKMAEAGVESDVLLSFVQNSKGDFNLSADDIIALKSAKVDASVIKAMLNHDAADKAAGSSSNDVKQVPLNPDPTAVPAPLVEAIPVAPGPGYDWVPGYWNWDGTTWVWVYGGWRPYGFFGWHHRRF